jgi:hypothetical protein
MPRTPRLNLLSQCLVARFWSIRNSSARVLLCRSIVPAPLWYFAIAFGWVTSIMTLSGGTRPDLSSWWRRLHDLLPLSDAACCRDKTAAVPVKPAHGNEFCLANVVANQCKDQLQSSLWEGGIPKNHHWEPPTALLDITN